MDKPGGSSEQGQPDQSQPPVEAPGPPPSSKERVWATFCHLAAFTALLGVPLGLVGGPLVVWLIKKDESPFVNRHGKAALNFQISMALYTVVAFLISWGRALFMFRVLPLRGLSIRLPAGLGFASVSFPLLVILVALDIVSTIIGAVRANKGLEYRYPFAIPLIR